MNQLRAHVYRDRQSRCWWINIDDPRPTPAGQVPSTWSGFECSWAEAMQSAYLMLRDLDRLLMDEVHASRASRRAQRCTECDEVVPEGKAHWKFNEGPCMILPAEQIDPDTAEETYTLEATS